MARRDAITRIQKDLVGRRSQLRSRLANDLNELGHGQSSSPSGDVADEAFGASGGEISSHLAEVEARELNQVEKALVRLKHGVYGMCEICSKKIPVARLNILPYSTTCMTCQRMAEKDADWLMDRRAANWALIQDGAPEREMKLSDLERE